MHHLLEAVIRGVIAFVTAFLITRVLNKQYMAKLTFFDFMVALSLGALVGHITLDIQESVWIPIVPVVIFALLALLNSKIAMIYRPVRGFLQGKPTVLIQDGAILDENMRRLRFNLDELTSQLRVSGIFDMNQVEVAIMEPGGHLSVLPKAQHRPVTPADLNLPKKQEGLSVELIIDGQLLEKNLEHYSLSKPRLMRELKARGFDEVKDIYFAALSSKGELFIDPFNDDIRQRVDLDGM